MFQRVRSYGAGPYCVVGLGSLATSRSDHRTESQSVGSSSAKAGLKSDPTVDVTAELVKAATDVRGQVRLGWCAMPGR